MHNACNRPGQGITFWNLLVVSLAPNLRSNGHYDYCCCSSGFSSTGWCWGKLWCWSRTCTLHGCSGFLQSLPECPVHMMCHESCHHKLFCMDQKLTRALFSGLNGTKHTVDITSNTSAPLTLTLLFFVLVWPLEHWW